MTQRLKTALHQIPHDLRHTLPGLAAAALYVFLMEYFFGAVCLSRVLIGIPCAGCGLTRAALLLLQGRFAESFALQPLLLLIPAGACLYLYEHYLSTSPRRYFTAYLLISLGLFVLLYLIRMKLLFPYQEPVQYDPDNIL